MTIHTNSSLVSGLSHRHFRRVLGICSSLHDVQEEVTRNYDENRWWPLRIRDHRLRMLLAGWSTRISYSMISSFQRVVHAVEELGYDRLCSMQDSEIGEVVHSLGLPDTRVRYLRSLAAFLDEVEAGGAPLDGMETNELIRAIAERVEGASYKVAQCAVLYAKGYHCGVFPVDSGMKDLLGPCFGLRLPRGPVAHEVMRIGIEELLNDSPQSYRELVSESGYGALTLPEGAPIWWAHLVLIYFKRLYCNRRCPSRCPLRNDPSVGGVMGQMCSRELPFGGGYGHVILEGVDGVGKTTAADELRARGYSVTHCGYNAEGDVLTRYTRLIEEARPPVVFDRFFMSEFAYGNALRSGSRLTVAQVQHLARLLAKRGCVVFHCVAPSDADGSQSGGDLELVAREYARCMRVVCEYLPVYEVAPLSVAKGRIFEHLCKVLSNGATGRHWERLA